MVDKYGTMISIGDEVLLDGIVYNVEYNLFTKRTVIDNEHGQQNLSDVHFLCEVIDNTRHFKPLSTDSAFIRKIASKVIQKAEQGDMEGAKGIIHANAPYPYVPSTLGLGNVNRRTIAELVRENNPLAIITTEDLVRELTRREEVVTTYKSETDDSEYKIKIGGEVVEYDGKATILLVKHRG